MPSNDPNQKTLSQCFRVEDDAASFTRNSTNNTCPNNIRINETNIFNGSLSQNTALSVAIRNSVIAIQNHQSNTNSDPNQTTLTQHFCSDDTTISVAARNNTIADQNHQSNTTSDPNQATLTQYFCSDDTAISVATRHNSIADQNHNSNFNDNSSAFADDLSINEAVDSVQSNDDKVASDKYIENNVKDSAGAFVDELSINKADDELISESKSFDSQETVFYDTSFLTQYSVDTSP